MEDQGTFTDFMISAMQGEDEVISATFIIRRSNGTVGYKCFNQEMADTLGLMRVATISVEQEMIESWKED